MAAINNLRVNIRFPLGSTDLPVLIVMHGWSGDTSSLSTATIDRLAALGFFVAVVGMRGRDDAEPRRHTQ